MTHNLFFLILDGIKVKLIESRSAEGFWNPPKGSLLFPWGHLCCVHSPALRQLFPFILNEACLLTEPAPKIYTAFCCKKKKKTADQLNFYGSLHSASLFLEHWIWSERSLRVLCLLSLMRCWDTHGINSCKLKAHSWSSCSLRLKSCLYHKAIQVIM